MTDHAELNAAVERRVAARFEGHLRAIAARAAGIGRSLSDNDREIAAVLACENRAERRRRNRISASSIRPYSTRQRRAIKQHGLTRGANR